MFPNFSYHEKVDREVKKCPHPFVSSRPQSRSSTNSDITPGCPALHVPHMLVSTWSSRHLVPGEGWDDRKCPHPFLSVRHPPDRQWLGQQHWVNSSCPGLQNHHFHRRYLYDRYNFHSSILSNCEWGVFPRRWHWFEQQELCVSERTSCQCW